MVEYERVHTEYACRRCGLRAEADVVAGTGVHGRANAAYALGLVPCPSCGRRDPKLLAIELIVPALGGLIVGGIAFVVAVIALLAVHGGVLAVIGAGLVGLAIAVWRTRSLLAKQLDEIACNVISIGDPIVETSDHSPYRMAHARPREQLPRPAFGARSVEAAYTIVFVGAAVLASMEWSATYSAATIDELRLQPIGEAELDTSAEGVERRALIDTALREAIEHPERGERLR